ncbi:MAG: HAMP domain-containing sensor histidine kinase [Bacteroidota bacterium]
MANTSDISKLEEELRIVNKKLLNAEKVQSDFLSNIKNEINNPLTSIMGLLKVVTANPADHQENAKVTAMVYREVHNLNFQMRNILTAAEIEAGQASPNVSNFGVYELVKEVTQSFIDIDPPRADEFQIAFSDNTAFTSDKEKVAIILSNLLSNALKFNAAGNKVLISIENSSPEKLELVVKDFGVGIKQDDLSSIFDRFRQLDSGTEKQFGGHGLGLSVVHALVNMLNGEFHVESSEGEGSTFTVIIPTAMTDDSQSVFYDDEEGILFGTDEEAEETF